MQLALQEGENRRSVSLDLTDDHAIELSTYDSGPIATRMWGRSYEFGVRVDPADAARLAMALIAEHYRDDVTAVDKLRDLAVRHGIDPHWWND